MKNEVKKQKKKKKKNIEQLSNTVLKRSNEVGNKDATLKIAEAVNEKIANEEVQTPAKE